MVMEKEIEQKDNDFLNLMNKFQGMEKDLRVEIEVKLTLKL